LLVQFLRIILQTKCIAMNRKITTRFIKKVYIVLAFGIVFKHFYLVTNGLDNKLVAGIIKPTQVSIDYFTTSTVAIIMILSFFYFLYNVKFSTRSIQ
jgi:hypothetical protein